VPKVISGEKRQTIRKTRKRPFKKGDKLYLYSGMRTKELKNLIFESIWNNLDGNLGDVYLHTVHPRYNPAYQTAYIFCKEVYKIEIVEFTFMLQKKYDIFIDNIHLNSMEVSQLAKDDGFNDLQSFIEFFQTTHGFPFEGQLIRW
jgi:hypothetical protein